MEQKIGYGSEWEEARRIVLHESRIVISTDEGPFHGFDFPGFLIHGRDANEWAEMFGLTEMGFLRNGKFISLKGLDIKIHQDYADLEESWGCKIDKVLVRIRGERLIDIDLTVHNKDQQDSWVVRYTYSGSYVVEWAR